MAAATPAPAAPAPARLARFTLTERLLHWTHAAAFLVMLASGLILYLPGLSAEVGRRPLVKDIHWWTAVSWAGALALIALAGNRRALARTVREIDLFSRDDRRWLRGDRLVPQGRFNAGQKVNAILTVAFAVLFAVSGALLWLGERNRDYRLDGTVFLHDALMYVSCALLGGHLYLAVIHPRTRHALQGMTLGTVHEEWAREHHARWVAELEAEREGGRGAGAGPEGAPGR